MGQDLATSLPAAAATFDAVSEATGVDLRQLCFETDEATLRQTQNAQLALFTCGVAAYRSLLEPLGTSLRAAAGHSVGEYAALVVGGFLSLEEGARLVQARGRLMAEAGQIAPGTMAAVLGLDREALEALLVDIPGAVVANDNCPGQLVISGTVEGVEAAGEAAKAAGAKRVLPLNVSGAFHSPLMEKPAAAMGEALQRATFQSGSGAISVYSNVTAQPETEWPQLMRQQLSSPVRWTESVQNMREAGVTTFIECGVGEVLCGLVRRIAPEACTLAVQDAASQKAALEILAQEALPHA